MQQIKYQQLDDLEGKLREFIIIQNKRIEETIIKIYDEESYENKVTLLKDKLLKLEIEGVQRDIKDTYIYELKHSKLVDELEDSQKKLDDIKNKIEIEQERLKKNSEFSISFDNFCKFLSAKLKTPKDVVNAFLKGGTYDLENYLDYFIENSTWEEDYSVLLDDIQTLYNTKVNSYNLNGKVDFSEKTFLMLNNTSDIGDITLLDDENDFYADVVSALGFYSKGDIEEIYNDHWYECVSDDFIAYLYNGNNDEILKKSKIVGITIERFIKNGISKCYPLGNCIGKVFNRIINKEITNIDRFSVLLDTIMERILPMLKSLSEEDLESVLDFDVDNDETIEIEVIEKEIEKLKKEFPEFYSNSVPNYVDSGKVIEGPRK